MLLQVTCWVPDWKKESRPVTRVLPLAEPTDESTPLLRRISVLVPVPPSTVIPPGTQIGPFV